LNYNQYRSFGSIFYLSYKTVSAIPLTRSGFAILIDFDTPRYGPLCVSIDDSDSLEFVWDEYHNLNEMPDENAYKACDFSQATKLVKAAPNPSGYKVKKTIRQVTGLLLRNKF